MIRKYDHRIKRKWIVLHDDLEAFTKKFYRRFITQYRLSKIGDHREEIARSGNIRPTILRQANPSQLR